MHELKLLACTSAVNSGNSRQLGWTLAMLFTAQTEEETFILLRVSWWQRCGHMHSDSSGPVHSWEDKKGRDLIRSRGDPQSHAPQMTNDLWLAPPTHTHTSWSFHSSLKHCHHWGTTALGWTCGKHRHSDHVRVNRTTKCMGLVIMGLVSLQTTWKQRWI